MKNPPFVEAVVAGLCLDLVLMVLLPFAGPAMLLVVAALLLVVPFYVGIVGVPSAMEWRTENRIRSNAWSSLAPLLCGSSLVFLLVVAGLEVLGEPDKYSQGEILLYVYLSILLMRFAAAGFINLLLSIPCFILSEKMDRISAGAAFVCSWAGLALSRDFFTPQSLIAEYSFIGFFVLVNFGFGLAWGGMVQWAGLHLLKTEESNSH